MGITKATPTTPPATLGVLPVKARGRQKASTLSTDEKRERILQAAEALFDRQGYANTTMEQIVQPVSYTHLDVYKRQTCRRGLHSMNTKGRSALARSTRNSKVPRPW